MADPPPIHVLAAFAASRLVEPLEGGQGDSFRAGGIVLKRTGDPIEARWIGELFATLGGPGFRVPRSVRTRDGDWLADGWTAFEFVAAQTAGRNGGRWPETLAACRAFHAALCDVPRPAFIANATHAWAVADRLAWDELQIEPLAPYGDIIARLRRLLRPLDLPLQLVHGDFTANVLFAAGGPPFVIDFSPYWRPALFAQAVVIADAITWGGAGESLAVSWCGGDPVSAQLLVRAVLRRVYERDQHTRRGRGNNAPTAVEYLHTVELVERLA